MPGPRLRVCPARSPPAFQWNRAQGVGQVHLSAFRCDELRGSRVSVVESAEVRNRDDLAGAVFDRAWRYSAAFLTRYLREKGINRDSSKQEKLPIAISLSGDQGFPHEGYIDYFDNTADSETGTIPVRGVLANTAGKLYPGLFARVRVPGATIADAVLVRDAAIGTDLAGQFLLTVGDNNIVERRYVELGPLQDGWRVITEGIGPGEEYIVDGIIRARPGLPVRTQAEAAVAGTKAPAEKDPSKKDPK